MNETKTRMLDINVSGLQDYIKMAEFPYSMSNLDFPHFPSLRASTCIPLPFRRT